MNYYQLWHGRSQGSQAGLWLRERIRSVAAQPA